MRQHCYSDEATLELSDNYKGVDFVTDVSG